MKLRSTSLFYALCFSLLVVVPAPTVFGAYSVVLTKDVPVVVSPSDQKLLDATVNLYCRVKSGNKTVSTTGTGVFIDSRGVILTNAHVAQYFLLTDGLSRLQSDCSVRVGSPARETYTADLLYLSPAWIAKNAAELAKRKPTGLGENDFALLYITGVQKKTAVLPASFPTVPLESDLRFTEGDPVVFAGYPAGALNYTQIKSQLMVAVASSTIANLRTFEPGEVDIIQLAPSKVASQGVSGGPILRNGELVGIAVTMSTRRQKEGANLRGLTLSYIDRAVRTQSGIPFLAVYAGDLATRASTTRATFSKDLSKIVEKGIRLIR